MKNRLFASTALVGAAMMAATTAKAAEAPTWKLTGNANFQFYWVNQDAMGAAAITDFPITAPTATGTFGFGTPTTQIRVWVSRWDTTGTADPQDHDWYFGVDEAELQLNVSGTADNGLSYGFKIEINANTTDTAVADEVRLQLSGGWGTLQMGDEDGAEDIMNYGGENLMGATGGFDGDQDDYLVRCTADGDICAGVMTDFFAETNGGTFRIFDFDATNSNFINLRAPSYPTIAGDTSDKTKISYFSPRFSGFQVGASITPTPNDGDGFKADGAWENHVGIGANYDNSFGDLRVRASAVYSRASNSRQEDINGTLQDAFEDISAWSVGGIVGWGPFSLGANYTDNGDSGQPIVNIQTVNQTVDNYVTAPVETSYWNVAAGFETGPLYFSAGYFASTVDLSAFPGLGDSTYEHIALTADYTVAAGLGIYAELNLINEELIGGSFHNTGMTGLTNDTTSFVAGANVSF